MSVTNFIKLVDRDEVHVRCYSYVLLKRFKDIKVEGGDGRISYSIQKRFVILECNYKASRREKAFVVLVNYLKNTRPALRATLLPTTLNRPSSSGGR